MKKKIKLIILILLLVLITVILCLYFMLPRNTKIDDTSENIEYAYYHGYYFKFRIAEKINDKIGIDNILSKINKLPEDIITKLNTYNEEYFTEKDLIIIYFPMGSGTPTSTLDRVTINDAIEVVINITNPGYGTADMSGHLYIIEIEKSNKELIVYRKTNDEEPTYLKSACEFNKTYKVVDVKKESSCQTITLQSLTCNETYKTSFCGDYITFEEGKLYKFTLTPYGTPSIEDSISNMIRGNFINIKIEETTEIINEDVCDIENRYLIETDGNYFCDARTAIQLYSEMDSYNLYTYCTKDIYVIDKNNRTELKQYLKTNPNFIDELTSKMSFEDIYDNGTTAVYRGNSNLFNNGLTIVKCSNSDIYITDRYPSFTKEPIDFCK